MPMATPQRRSLGMRIGRAAARFRGPGAWRAWGGLLLLLLLLAYLVYVFTRTDLADFDLGNLLRRIRPGDIALVAVLYGLTLALAIGCWALIIGRIAGCHRFFEHARSYLLTSVTRRLPGSFWHMLGRMVLYERLGVARGLSAVASGLEYLAMVLGGVLIALLAWPLVFTGQARSPITLLIPLLVCALALNPPLVRWLIRRFDRTGGVASVRYRQLMLWVLIYALIWCVGGLLLFVLVRAVAPISFGALPVVVGIWATAGVAATVVFNFLPFGLGATEITMTALLSGLIAPEEAFFVAVAVRVLLTLCELAYGMLGALMYLPDLLARRGPFAPTPEE